MAIWELDIEFLPRAWCEAHRAEELIDAEGSDASIAWRAHPMPSQQIEAALSSSFGPPSRPIDNDDSWLAWNDAQQNRFAVSRDGGLVQSFSVRIDARSSDEAGRKRVLSFAAAFDCVLWQRGAQSFLSTSLEQLTATLRSSRANAFANLR